MEDNQRAEKEEIEENSRNKSVAAQKREKRGKNRVNEQADAAESRVIALQSSNM